jgi:ABC-type nitrate/sulfonate/bicarbonate transport system substrate-binding protein
LLAAGGLLVAACQGTTPSAAPTGTAAAPATTAPTEAPSEPTGLPGTKEFTVGFTSVGLSSAPFLAALEKLRGEGYTIEAPELAESELVTEGVASGQFAFGSGANNAVLTAIEAGANLKAVVARVNNEWTMYARTDITDCAGLAGKRLAIHSEGAVSTAMVRNYVETTCPGTEPQYVVIPGSPNRLAALLADQIDASPLELSDSITVDNEASDRYHLLSSFAADLPDLQTTSIYVNGKFADENPGTVLALVKAVIEVNREIEGDAAGLQAIAEQFVGAAINPDTIAAASERYVSLGMFPTDGGLTAERMQYTAEFFGPDGTASTTAVIPLVQWTDLSFLQMALDELGG